MTSEMGFAVAGPHVISETIEGETVVINLDTGLYFSLGGTASEVWDAVAAGATRSQLLAQLEARYEADRETLARSLDDFLAAVAGDGLLRPEPSETEASDAAAAAAGVEHAATNGGRLPFAPPTVERFTDIQDLLLLDPIHEVDDRGWPNPRLDG